MYFLYSTLGGFKGRSHATGDVVYFLYAFHVITIIIPKSIQALKMSKNKVAILK